MKTKATFNERRAICAGFVRRLHNGQTMELGGAPCWHHLDRVSRMLQEVLEAEQEGAAEDRASIALAALGHDALEDVPGLSEENLGDVFSDTEVAMIRGMTNRFGNQGVPSYVEQVAHGPEVVRLIKLADLADNCAGVMHTVRRESLEWVRQKFLPIVEPMISAVQGTSFARYPRSAERLKEMVRSRYGALRSELDNYLLDSYLDDGLRSIKMMSRTSRGVLDVAASADKQNWVLEDLPPDRTESLAVANARAALEFCFANRDKSFRDSTELRGFIEQVVRTVNQGIIKNDLFLRAGADASFHSYTRVANLPSAYHEFSEEFFARLQTDDPDLAAWVEYRVDIKDHFFADGCGRVARILAAWAKMRVGLPLTSYRSREEFYGAGNPPDLAKFIAYYGTLARQQTVFVTGGTGFLGMYTLPVLLQRGHQVRCLVRKGSETKLGALRDRVEIVNGDLTVPGSLKGSMSGCDAVIHMAGLLEETPEDNLTYGRIIEEGLRRVCEEAGRANVQHVLFTSTFGARFEDATGFRAANRRAEQHLRELGFQRITIFRLNYVFGDPGLGREDSLLTHLRIFINPLPVLFIVGDGKYEVQPIHAADVALGLAGALHRIDTGERTYDASGPMRKSWLEFLDMIAQAAGQRLKEKVFVCAEEMPRYLPRLRRAGLTKFDINQRERTCDSTAFFRDFHVQATPFDLKSIAYLQKYNDGLTRFD